MKTFWFSILQTVIKSLIGSLDYERIKQLVMDWEETDLTGAQKRERVIAECQHIAVSVGAALLNLAIEIAVNSLKVKSS
jgi:hypothetical protein